MEMKRKVPTTIMFDREQLEALDRMADEGKVSKSKLVREALAKFLEDDLDAGA